MTTIHHTSQKSKSNFRINYKLREGAITLRAKKIGRLAAIIVCAAAAVWLTACVLLPVFWPFFVGLVIAALAKKPVAGLQKRVGLPRGLAAFLCVLGIYLLAGTGLFLLCRLLCREIGGFLHQLPALAGRLEGPAKALQTRLYALADKFPDGVGSGLRAGLTSFFESGARLGSKLYEKLFTFASGFLGKLPDLVLGAVTAVLSSFMLTAEYSEIAGFYTRHVPPPFRRKVSQLRGHLSQTLGAWLRAQGKLMGVTFLILTAGFLFLRVDYALLFAILTTIIDALPVFGTGTVLLPWSLLSFLRGDTRCGVGFLLLYAAAALTRQTLEPRLVGGQLGLPPVVTLAALYAGYRVMGVAGMIVFPLLSVFCLQIYRSLPQPDAAPVRKTNYPTGKD